MLAPVRFVEFDVFRCALVCFGVCVGVSVCWCVLVVFWCVRLGLDAFGVFGWFLAPVCSGVFDVF